MRFLLFLGLLFGGAGAAVPWILAWTDESGLRQDAAFAPEVSRANSAVHAGAIAHFLLRSAKERGMELTPEGLRIEVGAAHKGTYAVQGGVLKVQANDDARTVTVQDVTIHVQYDEPVYLGLTHHVEFTVETEGIGDGGPSTFPASEEKEADAQEPAASPAAE